MGDIYKISTTHLQDMMTFDVEDELDFPIISSHLKRQPNIPFISITCVCKTAWNKLSCESVLGWILTLPFYVFEIKWWMTLVIPMNGNQ